jgi:hypothetical protein
MRLDRFVVIIPLVVLTAGYIAAEHIPKVAFFWIPSAVYLYAVSIAIIYRQSSGEGLRAWVIAGSFALLFIVGGQMLILEQGIPTRWLDWGRFPTHDASDFLKNSHTILSEGSFTSIRGRPMANAFLASIWRFADFDLSTLEWIISGLCAVSLTIFGAMSVRVFGVALGVLPIAVAVDFGHEHLGSASTEPLGFCVGLIAVSLLLRAACRPTILVYAFGVFTLGLALFLRAGAMFVLPFLLLWPFMIFNGRKIQLQALALATISLVCVALAHVSVSRVLTPDSPSFVNAPKSWYAIVAMGDEARGLRPNRPVRAEARWRQIFDDNPGLSDLPIGKQGPRFIDILVENVTQRPLSFIVGIGVEYADQLGRAGLFRFVDNKALRAPIFLLFVLGLMVATWQWRRDALSGLLFFAGIGVILSIPFLHGGENRVHAATIGLMGVVVAFGVQRLLAMLGWRSELKWSGKTSIAIVPEAAYVTTILALVLIGAFVLPGTLHLMDLRCGKRDGGILWRAGSSVSVSLPSFGSKAFAVHDVATVETTIRDWQSVVARNGPFFYAPIDPRLIWDANRQLMIGPGVLAMTIDIAGGFLRREWIPEKLLNQKAAFCLGEKTP